MPNKTYKFFILTGDPGVGKTTLTKQLSTVLSGNGVTTTGFYTQEVRKNRVREGFDVVSLDGVRGRLARELNLLGGPSKHRVGKYGVLVEEFENVALPALEKPKTATPHLLVIDEIGKMEFFSEPFKNAIKTIFSPSSEYTVLATIPAAKGDPLIESIRYNHQAKVWMITKENRNTIHDAILTEMNKALDLE